MAHRRMLGDTPASYFAHLAGKSKQYERPLPSTKPDEPGL